MAHRRLLAALLPPVSYTPTAPHLAASLHAEGQALDGAQAAGAVALGALSPFRYPQWREDWERVYGLPDACARPERLLQEEIQLLALAFTERGGISREWLKHYAALGGYTVDMTEYRPFRADCSRAGDPLTNDAWVHAFRVHAPGEPVREFRAGQSRSGDALRVWGDSILECIINKYKPAHSAALFTYRADASSASALQALRRQRPKP